MNYESGAFSFAGELAWKIRSPRQPDRGAVMREFMEIHSPFRAHRELSELSRERDSSSYDNHRRDQLPSSPTGHPDCLSKRAHASLRGKGAPTVLAIERESRIICAFRGGSTRTLVRFIFLDRCRAHLLRFSDIAEASCLKFSCSINDRAVIAIALDSSAAMHRARARGSGNDRSARDAIGGKGGRNGGGRGERLGAS